MGDEIRVKAGASLDYESASSHPVTVTVTDAGGLSHSEALTIGVSNQNEAPIDITVAGGTVQENAAAGTVVATLGAADADAGSTFTYTLDDPSGLFEVVGDEIRVKAGASLDYESASSHPVTVTVTDAGGLSHSEALTIGVSNQNEAPIDITVAGGTVQENAAAGTVVATLGAADADAGSTFTYTLDDPSGLFEVVGDEIRVKAGASLDYESASSHPVTVTVTDAGGLSHSEALTIGVSNQNEAPIDITVAGGTVQENAAAGTVVATLGAADADAGSTFTYTLDDPSGLFEVVGDEIRVKAGASLDYESASSHPVTVTVTDAGGLSHSEALTIGVSNQNEAPIDITVAGGTVQENAAAGTVVATLGAADADAGSTFTYTLDDPSGLFEVVGDEIRVKAGASLDYESASSHPVTVTVTDAGGLSHSEALTIGVSNQNEAPIDITVAGGTVQENAAAGTVVATLGAADADAGSTFTYTLDDPSGLFEVVGDEIRVKAGASLDYESASSHPVTVTVTDAGGLSHSEALTIGVSNQNEAPIDITVAGGTVQENAAAGTVVATLGAADADAGSTFTYTLDDPSGLFEVVGDEIRVKAGAKEGGGKSEPVGDEIPMKGDANLDKESSGKLEPVVYDTPKVGAGLDAGEDSKVEPLDDEPRVRPGTGLDYESASSHRVTVTVTDAGGLSHSEALTIAVTNQNEAPTDITVAGGTVAENAAAGTVVATLGATDPDAGSTFTYALTSDPSGKFEVVGNEVRVKAGASLDYETAPSHQVNVTVTDAGGLTRTETVNIAVTNQNEAPTDITVAGGTVAENAAAGTVVATLGATDPDAGSTFTYALTSDPSGKFEVVGNEVRVKAGASLDYETAPSHQVNVTVTDAGGLDADRDRQHRRHQPERGPDRHYCRRRHGGRERRRWHRRRHPRRHGSRCGIDLHLCADVGPLWQVRGGGQ